MTRPDLLHNEVPLSPPTGPVPSGAVRYPALDGVRGVAVLGVVATHTFLLRDAEGLIGWVTAAAKWGWLGVDLFFVLSGFLITGILLRSERSWDGLRRFWVRRALRTWPLFYLTLGLAMTVLPYSSYFASTGLRDAVEHQGWFWLNGCNLLFAFRAEWSAEFLSHFWSLAVEEQFYLIWPVVLLVAGPRRAGWCCGVMIAVGVLTRLGMWWADAKILPMMVFTLCKADLLGWGGLAAWLVWRDGDVLRRVVAARVAVGLAALGLLTTAMVRGEWPVNQAFHAWMLPWVGVGFGACVYLSLRGVWTGWLGSGVLPWFGRYSFGIYVLHLYLKPVFDHFASAPAWGVWVGPEWGSLGYFGMVLGVSSGLAVASFHLFEARFLALKSRWG